MAHPPSQHIPGANESLTAPSSSSSFSSFSSEATVTMMDTTLFDGLLLPLLGGASSPFVRLLMYVTQTITQFLGIGSPSALLALGAVAWLLRGSVRHFLMSSVTLQQSNMVANWFNYWISTHTMVGSSRHLKAQTGTIPAWVARGDLREPVVVAGFMNFAQRDTAVLPQFSPAAGSHWFWHDGNLFFLRRQDQPVHTFHGQYIENEVWTISVFGRSIEPIKRLILTTRDFYFRDQEMRTHVFRPATEEQRSRGLFWGIHGRPHSRPIGTVVLEDGLKQHLLEDMNEYLDPRTRRWYERRGIPHRRGYLFHGPPGTGKTSLTFAAAGVFGLDIYALSLMDLGITDDQLLLLFGNMPPHCVILLEDVDSAGLRRPDDDADGGDGPKSGGSRSGGAGSHVVGSGVSAGSGTAAEKKKQQQTVRRSNITLAGLLNAIDGVASHEGRILVMTTNRPDTLEEALIRPGRIDLQICFSNITPEQAGQLFCRMYEPAVGDEGEAAAARPTAAAAASTTTSLSKEGGAREREKQQGWGGGIGQEMAVEEEGGEDEVRNGETGLTSRELRTVSEEFSGQIPPGRLSPAEVQGFLLKRKKDPRKAAAEVGEWVRATLGSKNDKSNVLKVQ